MGTKMTDALWQQWLSDWNRIVELTKKRGWKCEGLKITPPVSMKVVEDVQKKHRLVLPKEFIEVVTKYASSVELIWNGKEDKMKKPDFLPCLEGFWRPLWNIDDVGWLTNDVCRPSEDNAYTELYSEVWGNKTGFIEEGGGDCWAFDVKNGDENCAVWFLRHDDFEEPGIKLADGFIEYITLVSAWGQDVELDLKDAEKLKHWRDWQDGKEVIIKDDTKIDPAWTVKYYPGGRIEEAGLMVDGKKTGVWTFWEECGYKRAEIEFRDDQSYGKCVSYYWNGKIKDEGTYHDHWKPHAKWIHYNEQGKKISEKNWKDRQRHGEHLEWFDNGVLRHKYMYEDDLAHGEWFTWDKSGKLRFHTVYEKGKKVR